MFDRNDPTRELVRAPKLPMTPAQLDALRPTPAPAEAHAVASAKQIAYQSGVSALEGVILRIEELERKICFLEEQWVAAAAPRV